MRHPSQHLMPIPPVPHPQFTQHSAGNADQHTKAPAYQSQKEIFAPGAGTPASSAPSGSPLQSAPGRPAHHGACANLGLPAKPEAMTQLMARWRCPPMKWPHCAKKVDWVGLQCPPTHCYFFAMPVPC
eukprot:1158311-Pelagomonas_calceolata.AAC.2